MKRMPGAFFAFFISLLVFSHAADSNAQTIRNIDVRITDIFEGEKLEYLFRLANKLKANTREWVVRQELLFKEGDSFDSFLLEESERALRQLRFLRKVALTPQFDGEFVDVVVDVQDTWTLFPQFKFSSGSGTDRTSVGLVDSNLLGYGKRLEAFYADDEGRQTIEGVYEDNRLFGSQNRLILGHFDRSDGFRTVAGIGRPFRTLVDKYSWSLESDNFDLVGRLFSGGDERFIFRQEHIEFAGGYTISKGDPESRLERYTFGYNYERDRFQLADESDFSDIDLDPESIDNNPELLAEDREFSGPFFSYSKLSTDFLSANYIDSFERIEDYSIGRQFSVRLALMSKALGSRRDTLSPSIRFARGYQFDRNRFLRGEIVARTRLDSRGFDNTIFSFDSRYYDVQGELKPWGVDVGRGTFASALRVIYSTDLDRDREILLGANSGLRGYEARTFTGESSILLSLEERLTFAEDVFRLVNIGGAVFLDAGGTSNRGLGHIIQDNLFANVGVGIRIGFPRSSGGSVLRVDLAFPLRDFEDEDSFRLLVTSGQNFSAFLDNEMRTQVQTESVLNP